MMFGTDDLNFAVLVEDADLSENRTCRHNLTLASKPMNINRRRKRKDAVSPMRSLLGDVVGLILKRFR